MFENNHKEPARRRSRAGTLGQETGNVKTTADHKEAQGSRRVVGQGRDEIKPLVSRHGAGCTLFRCNDGEAVGGAAAEGGPGLFVIRQIGLCVL